MIRHYLLSNNEMYYRTKSKLFYQLNTLTHMEQQMASSFGLNDCGTRFPQMASNA